ncbi:hypothetical protein M0804_011608 [Polistes exclamans]|nr:hypothetical protein M0804_011608 [Polistes exclamans]
MHIPQRESGASTSTYSSYSPFVQAAFTIVSLGCAQPPPPEYTIVYSHRSRPEKRFANYRVIAPPPPSSPSSPPANQDTHTSD